MKKPSELYTVICVLEGDANHSGPSFRLQGLTQGGKVKFKTVKLNEIKEVVRLEQPPPAKILEMARELVKTHQAVRRQPQRQMRSRTAQDREGDEEALECKECVNLRKKIKLQETKIEKKDKLVQTKDEKVKALNADLRKVRQDLADAKKDLAAARRDLAAAQKVPPAVHTDFEEHLHTMTLSSYGLLVTDKLVENQQLNQQLQFQNQQLLQNHRHHRHHHHHRK